MRALRPQKNTNATAGIKNRQIRADGIAALLDLRERIEARLNSVSLTENSVPKNKRVTAQPKRQ